MVRKAIVFSILVIFLISLSGCATTRKRKNLEIQGLKNQISVLETQLQDKDLEISSLREELNKVTEEKEVSRKKKVVPEVKSRPSVRQIQTALRNAGYNPGVIDGRMGRQTRDAIRAFQRANNLSVDGKVGKRTWALLGEYLYKKIK